MKIIVNATTLRVAGGLSIGQNFLKAFNRLDTPHVIHAFVPPNCGYEELATTRTYVHAIPAHLQKAHNRLYLDYIWMPKQIDALAPDVIYSMGNIALPIKKYPQAILFHWPYAVYPESKVWQDMEPMQKVLRRIRLEQFRFYTRYAQLIIVQGNHIKKRMNKYFNIPMENMAVAHSAVSLYMDKTVEAAYDFKKGNPKTFVLGYPARYYSHKNIEIFLPLAELIKQKSLPIVLVTTVDPAQAPRAAAFVQAIEERGLQDIIKNVGNLAASQIGGFYKSIDALLFPSFLESFGLPNVEAMHYGKPIFSSDMDFQHEAGGDAAFYFDPFSAADILNTITKAIDNPALLQDKIEKGKVQLATFRDWNHVARTYLDALEQLVAKSR